MQEVERLYIIETTLANNKKLSIEQKVSLAEQLEKLKVDAVLIDHKNKEFVEKILPVFKETKVVACANLSKEEIDETWATIKSFPLARLRLVLEPSLFQDFNLDNVQVKKDAIKMVVDAIQYAKKLSDEVDFTIVKFDKLHRIFMYRLIEAAADSKANVITVTLDEHKYLTHEFSELINDIMYNLPEAESLILGVSCRNSIGLATANTLAAIINGARQIDVNLMSFNTCTDNASLKAILKVYNMRTDLFNQNTRLAIDELEASYKLYEELIKL
jgi:2-isopropylmalate synthase